MSSSDLLDKDKDLVTRNRSVKNGVNEFLISTNMITPFNNIYRRNISGRLQDFQRVVLPVGKELEQKPLYVYAETLRLAET